MCLEFVVIGLGVRQVVGQEQGGEEGAGRGYVTIETIEPSRATL